MENLWKLFQWKNIEYQKTISIDGGNISKLVNMTYVLDYASI